MILINGGKSLSRGRHLYEDGVISLDIGCRKMEVNHYLQSSNIKI